MISQLIGNLSKFVYVGDTAGFIPDATTTISCIAVSFSYVIEKQRRVHHLHAEC